MRRLLPLALIALAALVLAASAEAADYPSRVIRLIVPYPAGGTSDVLARVLAKKMGDKSRDALRRVRYTLARIGVAIPTPSTDPTPLMPKQDTEE